LSDMIHGIAVNNLRRPAFSQSRQVTFSTNWLSININHTVHYQILRNQFKMKK